MVRNFMTMLGMVGLVLALVVGGATKGDATEFDMRIYVLPEAVLRAAIGSDDSALQAAMLGDADYIADMDLDARFTDGRWREAVGQLVAGQGGRMGFANGFALELLARQLTPADARFEVLLPFADLANAAIVMKAAGHADSAAFLRDLNAGASTRETGLAAEIGVTEYPARVWVVPADGVAQVRAALPAVAQVAETLDALVFDPESAAAAEAEKILEAAIRAYLAEPWHDPMSPAEIEARVARELDDPYMFTDHIIGLVEQIEPIEAALDRAAAENAAALFVYRSW